MRWLSPPPDRASALALGFFGTLALLLLLGAGLELLPVAPAFGHAAAAFLASRALWRPAARHLGEPWGVAARGAGWAGATLLALGALEAPYATAAPAAAAFVAGAHLFAAPRGRRAAAVPWLVAGLALVVWSFRLAAPLGAALPGERWRLDAVLALATAALVGTRVLRGALRGRSGPVLRALVESELRNAAVVVPFGAYALYRDVLAVSLRHFSVYEWSLGVALAAYVVSAVRSRFREAVTPDPWTLAARRHAQAVEPRPSPAFAEAVALFDAYVDRGESYSPYARFWRERLAALGVPDADAAALVARAEAAPASPAARAILRRRAAADAWTNARDKRAEAHRALLARAVDASTELSRDAGRNERERRLQPHP